MRDDETLEGLLGRFAAQNARDPASWSRPWTSTCRFRCRTTRRGFRRTSTHWSVRWVVLHIIEELARHAGHADIIRESIDGATMYELIAGLEGWPETDWLKPFKPAG